MCEDYFFMLPHQNMYHLTEVRVELKILDPAQSVAINF